MFNEIRQKKDLDQPFHGLILPGGGQGLVQIPDC
jgi:hypothetical protein